MTERTHTILVADDALDARLIMRSALRKAGFAVTLAESGMEALRKFRESRCDMVMLDVERPDMDGYAACAALREEAGPLLPIFSTGRWRPRRCRRCCAERRPRRTAAAHALGPRRCAAHPRTLRHVNPPPPFTVTKRFGAPRHQECALVVFPVPRAPGRSFTRMGCAPACGTAGPGHRMPTRTPGARHAIELARDATGTCA